MAWRRIGDKPLSEPMLTRFTHWRIYAALGGDGLSSEAVSREQFYSEWPCNILYNELENDCIKITVISPNNELKIMDSGGQVSGSENFQTKFL